MFVRDDASKPPLSILYRGPYHVLPPFEHFFVIQIGDKLDSVSVDRLKPVVSSVPVVPGVPPVHGRHRLKPASIPGPPVQDRPPVKKVTFSPLKKVRFSPVTATQLRWNPHRTVPRFSASLCCPPSSPFGGSNCGYHQLDGDLHHCLFFISTFEACLEISESRLFVFPFPVHILPCILNCKYIYNSTLVFRLLYLRAKLYLFIETTFIDINYIY